MSYKVELDVYSGPLDLLLHLIARDELTVERIPVARVADQFVKYLEGLTRIDIEVAGDFLVMAARLTEMKSRALLPQLTTEDEEIDPDLLSEESDLIQRLLEYRGFKDASRWLRSHRDYRALLYSRRAALPELETEDLEEEAVLPDSITVYDLLSAYHRLSREVMLDEVHTVVYDDVPIEEHIQILLDRIEKEEGLAFSYLMPPGANKLYVIGAFLALLELIRQKKILVEQEEDFGGISVERPAAAPPENGANGGPGGPPPAVAPQPPTGEEAPPPPAPPLQRPAGAPAPAPEEGSGPGDGDAETEGTPGHVDDGARDAYDDPEANP
ncbi:MAG: segregation and condensation protein A [Planctomycetota bacterium]|jgi:segregation and condensation protein A